MNKITLFRGSPRQNGNTNALAGIFEDITVREGRELQVFDLYSMDIRPCTACRVCQKDWSRAYCVQKDDMEMVFHEIQDSTLLVIATPIYSWYCTAPVKAMLDRLVYAMNKYYGAEKGPSLWVGKKMALITTCGYRPEKGADVFEEGMKRYCRHSQLEYTGMLCERHLGYNTVFMDDEKRI